MSKKFGKFLLFSAIAGASAYGAYHYLKTKENSSCPGNTDDADDDFDDFSEDLDDEPESAKERSYVSLNLDKAEAIATEAFHKAKKVIVDSVNQVKETVKSVVESQSSSDANFTDLTALNKEKEAEGTTEEFFDDAESSSEDTDSKASDAAPAASAAENAAPAAEPETDDNVKAQADGKVEDFFDD